MDLEKLGKLLKERREEKRLTLRGAAEKLGLSHSYLSTIEKAKDPRTGLPIKPSIETLESIVSLYEMDFGNVLELAGYTIDLDNLYGISKEELPDALREIGVEYIAFAKEVKEKHIPLDKIRQIIDLLDLNK